MADATNKGETDVVELDGHYRKSRQLSARQVSEICRIVADAIDHEGEAPGGSLLKDLEHLSGMYKGYKNAYHVLNAEVGRFRAYSAPYVRPDEEAKNCEDKPGIFLVTLPKSATVYIANSIASTLGYTLRHTIVTPTFPKNVVWAPMMYDFKRGGLMSVSHMQPDAYNMRTVKEAGLRKGVLHIRDPRAALLSWVHFVNKRGDSIDAGTGSILNPLIERARQVSFSDRVDGCIGGFFLDCVAWIEGWMEQLKIDPRMDFLIVNHDELVADEEAYFDRIMKHYNLKAKISTVVRDETTHFRNGDNDEWRSVLSAKQIQTMNDAIPDWMWDRFGWQK
jgi:hypothetical protein